MLTEKAFPSSLGPELPDAVGNEKPLPPRPITWLDTLPPLILRHSAENLRVLDLTFCKLTDDAVEGIVTHAPKIQSLILSGCSLLTDRAVGSICKLGEHLDVLMLAHVANITDPAIVKLTRSCVNLRCVDVACELSYARLMFICLCIINDLLPQSLPEFDRYVGIRVCRIESPSTLEFGSSAQGYGYRHLLTRGARHSAGTPSLILL